MMKLYLFNNKNDLEKMNLHNNDINSVVWQWGESRKQLHLCLMYSLQKDSRKTAGAADNSDSYFSRWLTSSMWWVRELENWVVLRTIDRSKHSFNMNIELPYDYVTMPFSLHCPFTNTVGTRMAKTSLRTGGDSEKRVSLFVSLSLIGAIPGNQSVRLWWLCRSILPNSQGKYDKISVAQSHSTNSI